MIKINYIADVVPDDGLIGYLDSQREIVEEIITEVHGEVAPLALDELRAEPPPAKYPIQWTSIRQMRYVMGFVLEKDANGNIIPYERTHELANAWKSYIRQITDAGFGLVFENPSDAAKFVGGSLAQDRTQALRFKQGFHDNTGWQDYTDTVQFWLETADELFIKKYDERIGEFGKVKTRQRAYTSG